MQQVAEGSYCQICNLKSGDQNDVVCQRMRDMGLSEGQLAFVSQNRRGWRKRTVLVRIDNCEIRLREEEAELLECFVV